MDLISAVDLAFKSDPQFLRDKNLLDKQKELVNQARAPLMPNISSRGRMPIQKTQQAMAQTLKTSASPYHNQYSIEKNY